MHIRHFLLLSLFLLPRLGAAHCDGLLAKQDVKEILNVLDRKWPHMNLTFSPAKAFTTAELEQLLTLPSRAEELVARLNESGWPETSNYGSKVSARRLLRDARIILSRIDLARRGSALPLTEPELERQARIAAFAIETKSSAYRFDSRPPAEIRSSGGFYPNPRKEITSLIEHSFPEYSHGGSFVSTTLLAENDFVVQQILRELRLERLYEYELKDVTGAVVNPSDGINSEAEFVATHVPYSRIGRYRVVTRMSGLAADPWYEPGARVAYGPWHSIQDH